MGFTEGEEAVTALASAAGYAKLTFAIFTQDDYRDDRKLYSLKDIFANDSDPYNFEYGTGRTMSFRMTAASLIRSEWEHVLAPNFL